MIFVHGKYEKVVLVRSLIPTREIGFLPGDEEDKAALYQVPYQNMVQFMFEQPNEQAFKMLYDRLKTEILKIQPVTQTPPF